MPTPLINQTDSQGRKQGYWEETQKSAYTEKGHYVDGLRQGVWKTYYIDGTLWSEGTYLNDMRHGLWKHYYEDGVTLSKEFHYLNGQLYGSFKGYDKDGTLSLEEHYLNGERHKFSKSYYPDGTISSETEYFEKGDSFNLQYYPGGTISSATYYYSDENEEPLLIPQEKIEVYNKIISSVGQKAWRAIPRELFDYLHYIEIF